MKQSETIRNEARAAALEISFRYQKGVPNQAAITNIVEGAMIRALYPSIQSPPVPDFTAPVARKDKGDPNARLKKVLVDFWARFGGKNRRGRGFDSKAKLDALITMSRVVIQYHKQLPLEVRRQRFDEAKSYIHPLNKFGECFVCDGRATARHHIVQLQNGGINSKKNVVSLCDDCHAEVHPWLKESNS